MLNIREAIVVEGRYDKIALEPLVDTAIFTTEGFGIFKDREKMELLRRVAEKRGLIVFTDPDGAGLVIRNRLKSCIPPEHLKHAYIPDVPGRERRKKAPSRAGTLGVEGMRPEVLAEALSRAGATETGGEETPAVTRADLYALGLFGRENSALLRRRLQKALGLPERLSAGALLDAVNCLYRREEFSAAAEALQKESGEVAAQEQSAGA